MDKASRNEQVVEQPREKARRSDQELPPVLTPGELTAKYAKRLSVEPHQAAEASRKILNGPIPVDDFPYGHPEIDPPEEEFVLMPFLRTADGRRVLRDKRGVLYAISELT